MPVGSTDEPVDCSDTIQMYFSDTDTFANGLDKSLSYGATVFNVGDQKDFYMQGHVDLKAVPGNKVIKVFVKAKALR